MEEFFRNEIINYINNTESELYCKLTDEEVEQVANNTINEIMCDDEMNRVISYTIGWYVDHYICNMKGEER